MNKAFTLLELLVVIAIMGILSSVVLASLNSARGSSTDTKIKTEMRSIQNAVSIFYLENGTYEITHPDLGSVCGSLGNGVGAFTAKNDGNYGAYSVADCLNAWGYLPANFEVPDDPVSANSRGNYRYHICDDGDDYSVSAVLGNPTPAEIDNVATLCNGSIQRELELGQSAGYCQANDDPIGTEGGTNVCNSLDFRFERNYGLGGATYSH